MTTMRERMARVHRKVQEEKVQKAESAKLGRQAISTETVLTAIERRRKSDRQRDEVERLSREGLKVEEIVARTGLTYSNVCKMRHDRQVNPRKGRKS